VVNETTLQSAVVAAAKKLATEGVNLRLELSAGFLNLLVEATEELAELTIRPNVIHPDDDFGGRAEISQLAIRSLTIVNVPKFVLSLRNCRIGHFRVQGAQDTERSQGLPDHLMA
jgi:hypothetical protein